MFANRDASVANVEDLATLVRHEKPPTPRAAASTPPAAPVLSTPRHSEARESFNTVTPPLREPRAPAPTPSASGGQIFGSLDVSSLLREAAASVLGPA